MLLLDLYSKKEKTMLRTTLLWFSALAAAAGCTSSAPTSTGKSASQAKAAEGQSAEQENAGTPSGALIAPPPGTAAKRFPSQVDELLDQVPESARGDDGELAMPVDPSLLPGSEKRLTPVEQRRREFNARRTDQEVVGATRATDDTLGRDLGDIDRKLKVTPEENSGQAPSFTLGIQKVKELFKEKLFEDALIETNEMLRFYPKSAQVLLMKGTLHQRLGQVDLALSSYKRAYEYEPSRKLLAQIESLQRVVTERESLRPTREGLVVPGGVQEIKVLPRAKSPEEK